MKIVETHDIGTEFNEYYGKGSVSFSIVADNGEKEILSIMAGEPEDACFNRDLNDVLSIGDALLMAYEAGKRGEDLDYEFIDENSEEDEEEAE